MEIKKIKNKIKNEDAQIIKDVKEAFSEEFLSMLT